MFSTYAVAAVACGSTSGLANETLEATLYMHELMPRPPQQGDPGGSELSPPIFACFIPLTAVEA